MFASPALHAAAEALNDDALSKAITVMDVVLKDGLRSTADAGKKTPIGICYVAMVTNGMASLHQDKAVRAKADSWHLRKIMKHKDVQENFDTSLFGMSVGETLYNITYDEILKELITDRIKGLRFATHPGLMVPMNISYNSALQLSDKQILQLKAAHLCLVYKLKEHCTRNPSDFDTQFKNELAPSVSTESASKEAASESGSCLLQ
jgi:hypothetical protein